jgi:hypothetical protein
MTFQEDFAEFLVQSEFAIEARVYILDENQELRRHYPRF